LPRIALLAPIALLLGSPALATATPAAKKPAATASAAKKPAPAAHKGDVTRAQMKAQVKQVFDMADTNHDGFMSRQEFAARMGAVINNGPTGATKDQAQKMLDAANLAFNNVDANHDGRLSLDEASKRPLAAFDKMDANHDGILTMQEKIAAHSVPDGPAAPGGAPSVGAKQGPGR
jgi:hypothetical protein